MSTVHAFRSVGERVIGSGNDPSGDVRSQNIANPIGDFRATNQHVRELADGHRSRVRAYFCSLSRPPTLRSSPGPLLIASSSRNRAHQLPRLRASVRSGIPAAERSIAWRCPMIRFALPENFEQVLDRFGVGATRGISPVESQAALEFRRPRPSQRSILQRGSIGCDAPPPRGSHPTAVPSAWAPVLGTGGTCREHEPDAGTELDTRTIRCCTVSIAADSHACIAPAGPGERSTCPNRLRPCPVRVPGPARPCASAPAVRPLLHLRGSRAAPAGALPTQDCVSPLPPRSPEPCV